MRRAREDEKSVEDPDVLDPEAREDDAHITTRVFKRKRTGRLPPMVFVTFVLAAEYGLHADDGYLTNNFFFRSQDVVKRRNVLETIRELASMSEDGPYMANALFLWIMGNWEDDAHRLENTLPRTQDAINRAYLRLNPQPGEWSARTLEANIRSYPGSTITIIHDHHNINIQGSVDGNMLSSK